MNDFISINEFIRFKSNCPLCDNILKLDLSSSPSNIKLEMQDDLPVLLAFGFIINLDCENNKISKITSIIENNVANHDYLKFCQLIISKDCKNCYNYQYCSSVFSIKNHSFKFSLREEILFVDDFHKPYNRLVNDYNGEFCRVIYNGKMIILDCIIDLYSKDVIDTVDKLLLFV